MAADWQPVLESGDFVGLVDKSVTLDPDSYQKPPSGQSWQSGLDQKS